jgi:VWFA-related protein
MSHVRRISRRSLLAGLASLPVARGLWSQQTPTTAHPVAPYSATVKVVNLWATVRNKQGQLVNDLKQDDFSLDEEGRPQVIRYFSRETDLPLTLGLLVDTSGSQRTVLPAERTASFRFLDKVMHGEKDSAFLIHFDSEVELLQDLTSSRDALRKACDMLEIGENRGQLNQRGQGAPQGGGRYPRGGGQGRGGRGGTDLYDAVFLGADEIMRKQQGRKALVVLSDGVDTGSKESITQALESSQRADTLIYAILFADPNGYSGFGGFGGRGGGRRGGSRAPATDGRDGKKVLERLAGETGGRFFEVSKKLPIDQVFDAIQEELRGQYSIGYTSDNPDKTSGYRRIHLAAKQKELVVQAREGYYPE